jgi:invasion protein IalB
MVRINFALGIVVLILGFSAVLTVAASVFLPLPVVQEQMPVFAGSRPTVALETHDSKPLQDGPTFGWRLECPAEFHSAGRDCDAERRLIWRNPSAEGVTVALAPADRDRRPYPRMRIIVPPGSYLPAGLSVKLEDEEPFSVPFQFCTENGCFVNLDLADDVVTKMKTASLFTVFYKNSEGAQQSVDVPLDRFAEELDALQDSTLASR